MSGDRGRGVTLVVLMVTVLALVSSTVWAFAAGASVMAPGNGSMMGTGMPMMGSGMMPGGPGTSPVRDLAAAEGAAQRFADGWGLDVGEVMQFSNGFYAQLQQPSGEGATEVLIDAGSGSVYLEHGPAMMWNSAYGMMPGTGRQQMASVSPNEARAIADGWLMQNRSGLRAGEAEAFPGYYTLHTQRGDQVVGMMSVAQTGAVWYHTWHGQFLRMREPAG